LSSEIIILYGKNDYFTIKKGERTVELGHLLNNDPERVYLVNA
jgi:hypothetical protein